MICVGGSHVLIGLLEVSHRNGIFSLFTGKYNFGVFPGWGICTIFLSPTVGHLQLFQNKMTNARGRGDGHAWNCLSHNEKKKLFPLKFHFAVLTDNVWRDLFSSCRDISSKTVLNSFSVWNHSVKHNNNNKNLNSVLSFGNAWRWKIDETGKTVFFVTKLVNS